MAGNGLDRRVVEALDEELETALAGVGDRVLAVALGEIDLLGRAAGDVDERVGEALGEYQSAIRRLG